MGSLMEGAPVPAVVPAAVLGRQGTARYRNICWTLYNVPDIATTIQVGNRPQQVVNYLVYQQEICPNTQRLHYQGYMEFNCQLALSTIKDKVFKDQTVHVEARRGTQDQAVDYCIDGGKRAPGTEPTHWGTKHEQGTRRGFSMVVRAIDSGASLDQVSRDHPDVVAHAMQWTRQLFVHASARAIPHWRSVAVYVLWGTPGSGKTRRVYHANDPSDVYHRGEPGQFNKLWWCGYEQQRVLLIDDFYGSGTIGWNETLNILDGHRLRLEIKGGHTWAAWETVYITSNVHPSDWYKSETNEEKRMALYRRLTHIIHLEGPCREADFE